MKKFLRIVSVILVISSLIVAARAWTFTRITPKEIQLHNDLDSWGKIFDQYSQTCAVAQKFTTATMLSNPDPRSLSRDERAQFKSFQSIAESTTTPMQDCIDKQHEFIADLKSIADFRHQTIVHHLIAAAILLVTAAVVYLLTRIRLLPIRIQIG
jgi:hypothetical protein